MTSDTPDGSRSGSGQPPAWLVPVQGVAMVAHLLPGGPGVALPGPVRAAGAGAVLLGAAVVAVSARALGRDLTPAVTPRAGASLRTDGVYGLSRHPLYAGLLVASAGAVLVRGRASTAAAAVALAGVLHVKALAEDRVLAERFGERWRAYAAHVPRLVGWGRSGQSAAAARSPAPSHQTGSTTPSASV